MNNYLPTNGTTWTKMDKLLEVHILPELNQKESENLHREITPSESEAIIKKLPTNKSPGLGGFTGNFTKHSEKN